MRKLPRFSIDALALFILVVLVAAFGAWYILHEDSERTECIERGGTWSTRRTGAVRCWSHGKQTTCTPIERSWCTP